MKKNKIYSQSELISMGYSVHKLEEMASSGGLKTFIINGKKYYRLTYIRKRKPGGNKDN